MNFAVFYIWVLISIGVFMYGYESGLAVARKDLGHIRSVATKEIRKCQGIFGDNK